MYLDDNIVQMHQLYNESGKLVVVYKSDQRKYTKNFTMLIVLRKRVFYKGLSNMCNVAHVKTSNSSNFFFEKQQLFIQ